MSIVSHHQHKRERKSNVKHPYPAEDQKIKTLDNIVSVVSFLFPLTAAPQIYNIWIMKNVQGVSLLTWLLFLILGIILFLYAIVHGEKRLRIMFGMWVIVYFLAVVGLLIYQ